MRSATQPENPAPSPLASKVSAASLPAVALLMPKSATMAEMTSAKSMTSKASKIQPRAAATRVRRSAGVVWEKEKVAVAISARLYQRLPDAAPGEDSGERGGRHA